MLAFLASPEVAAARQRTAWNPPEGQEKRE